MGISFPGLVMTNAQILTTNGFKTHPAGISLHVSNTHTWGKHV